MLLQDWAVGVLVPLLPTLLRPPQPSQWAGKLNPLGSSNNQRWAMKTARVCIVEGEIAAGKSALIKATCEELRRQGVKAVPVYEPVDLWRRVGILGAFYADPGRYAYSFQTFVYATRALRIAEVVEAEPDADIYLLERSPVTDTVFMYAQQSVADPVEMALYSYWCQAYARMLPFDLTKAKVFYLQTSLNECMNRLSDRARKEEIRRGGAPTADDAGGGVSIEYQRKLRALHEAFFLGRDAESYPELPESPFPRESVVVIGPELADLDWRDPAEGQDLAVKKLVELILQA